MSNKSNKRGNQATKAKPKKPAKKPDAVPDDYRIVMGIRWHPDTYQTIETFRAKHGLRSMNVVARIGTKLLLGIKDEETALLDKK